MADEVTKDTAVASEEVTETAPEENTADSSVQEQEREGEAVEIPEKFKKLIEEIDNMSVLELHELVKVLEKKYGVSAAAVAVAGPAAGAAEAEEKTEFTVELTGVGDSKIGVMKAVKELLGLGLKEAKELVEGVPAVLKENVSKEEAESIKAKIEEAGGTVELK